MDASTRCLYGTLSSKAFSGKAASSELSAVLSAARLRAEGMWALTSGGGEDKPVEASVTAIACSDFFQQGLEDLWNAFPEKVSMTVSSCPASESCQNFAQRVGFSLAAMLISGILQPRLVQEVVALRATSTRPRSL